MRSKNHHPAGREFETPVIEDAGISSQEPMPVEVIELLCNSISSSNDNGDTSVRFVP